MGEPHEYFAVSPNCKPSGKYQQSTVDSLEKGFNALHVHWAEGTPLDESLFSVPVNYKAEVKEYRFTSPIEPDWLVWSAIHHKQLWARHVRKSAVIATLLGGSVQKKQVGAKWSSEPLVESGMPAAKSDINLAWQEMQRDSLGELRKQYRRLVVNPNTAGKVDAKFNRYPSDRKPPSYFGVQVVVERIAKLGTRSDFLIPDGVAIFTSMPNRPEYLHYATAAILEVHPPLVELSAHDSENADGGKEYRGVVRDEFCVALPCPMSGRVFTGVC